MITPLLFMFAFLFWMYAVIYKHLKRVELWSHAPFGILSTINRIHFTCVSKENCEFLPKQHIDWLLEKNFARFETSTNAHHLSSDLDPKLSLTKEWHLFFDKLTTDFDHESPIT